MKKQEQEAEKTRNDESIIHTKSLTFLSGVSALIALGRYSFKGSETAGVSVLRYELWIKMEKPEERAADIMILKKA